MSRLILFTNIASASRISPGTLGEITFKLSCPVKYIKHNMSGASILPFVALDISRLVPTFYTSL